MNEEKPEPPSVARTIGWRGFGALIGAVGVIGLGQLFSLIGGS